MASLFFGEMFVLRLWPRIALLTIAILTAVIVNIGRAMTLAAISFDDGEEAFDKAHDAVGYIAFAIAAVVLFIAAATLNHFRVKPRGRVVVRRMGAE